LYLSVVSRPDISFVVSNLSRFLANPGKVHWLAAKRVLRYLKVSLDYSLNYGCGEFSHYRTAPIHISVLQNSAPSFPLATGKRTASHPETRTKLV
jgi:hypothetical protein